MSDASSDSRPLRIFVVENHADTLKYLTMYLEGMGHTVQSATTMETALAALPQADCDVLMSDIGLPDGDGWQLLQRAKLLHPMFTIAMSGFGMNADRLKSQAAGYRRHLLKPFKPEEIDAVLDEAARESVG